ncbi:MAG: thioredoxin domain-containing protein [Pseudomonadota bacterium]
MGAVVIQCAKCETKNKVADVKQHLQPRCGKCKEPLDVKSHAVPVELGDATMDAFLQAARLPVCVDFFSPTCGPCKSLAPVLDDLTRQFFGKVIVAKVDTSKNPGCATHFQIRGVPTLLFFQKGKMVEQIVGLPEPGHLKAKMTYYGG